MAHYESQVSRCGISAQITVVDKQGNGTDRTDARVQPLRIRKPSSPEPDSTSGPSQVSILPPSRPQPGNVDQVSFPRPQTQAYPAQFPQHPHFREQKSALLAQKPATILTTAIPNTSAQPRIATNPSEARSGLAERRRNIPKPLPESPGPDLPDKEGMYEQLASTPALPRSNPSELAAQKYNQQYGGGLRTVSANVDLFEPKPGGMNRFSSTASISTTKASRGSPAPPETPIIGPGENDESGHNRFSFALGSGTNEVRMQSAASAQRAQQYATSHIMHEASVPQMPDLHDRSFVKKSDSPATAAAAAAPNGTSGAVTGLQPSTCVIGSTNAIEHNLNRMQIAADPPPAYSRDRLGMNGVGNGSQVYSSDKGHPTAVTTDFRLPLASPALQHPGHPAFANDLVRAPEVSEGDHQVSQFVIDHDHSHDTYPPLGPSSPPPLPEGWIAHLDQVSGQYYYIHLPTQATQWEFPQGPTPLKNEIAPMSPTASVYGHAIASPSISTYKHPLGSPAFSLYGGKPMGSPSFQPHTPGYAGSIFSMNSQTPTVVGFSGPPPAAGVEMYKVAPTNTVYFGPYLKYVNMDLATGTWLGSIMIITDSGQPPTIHIHKSVDLSPSPRQLQARPIFIHQRWTFYRYEVDLPMEEGTGDRWTYAVTSHLGCTRYEFLVAGRYETCWKFIAHSGNDFSPSTNQAERTKLGGVSHMWKDVLQKNVDCGGFHVQLGLGNQIYGDRLWKEVPLLKQWLAMSGKENRKSAQWTAKHEEDVNHAYFHYYTSHFDQPYLREAFAQIPQILTIDDHDIFDGYGSYPEYMHNSIMFKNIGRIGIEMYLLFQHQTTLELLRNVSNDLDLFTVTGNGWHFLKYLGSSVVVVGPDCRSERTQSQVMAGPTYQGLFPKIAMLPPSVQHCIMMLPVPIVYPRMEAAESFATTMATGKKAVNSTYNLLGKVTSSVAGVVGGKEIVASGFSSVKKAVGKQGLMGGVLNSFGEVDVADDLKDMWTRDSKDLERTYLIRTLQGISHQKGIRITFLSGATLTSSASLLHDPSHPTDHKTMYQLTTSPIVAAPLAQYHLRLLPTTTQQKAIYVPENGHKSTPHTASNTKEDMLDIFTTEPTSGTPRENKRLLARRGYLAIMAFDPSDVHGDGSMVGGCGGGSGINGASTLVGSSSSAAGSICSGRSGEAGRKLSLAANFVMQCDGPFGAPVQYGPVVVPSLEFGR